MYAVDISMHMGLMFVDRGAERFSNNEDKTPHTFEGNVALPKKSRKPKLYKHAVRRVKGLGNPHQKLLDPKP